MRKDIEKSGRSASDLSRIIGNSANYVGACCMNKAIDPDALERVCLILGTDKKKYVEQHVAEPPVKSDAGLGKQIEILTKSVMTLEDYFYQHIAFQKKQMELEEAIGAALQELLALERQTGETVKNKAVSDHKDLQNIYNQLKYGGQTK